VRAARGRRRQLKDAPEGGERVAPVAGVPVSLAQLQVGGDVAGLGAHILPQEGDGPAVLARRDRLPATVEKRSRELHAGGGILGPAQTLDQDADGLRPVPAAQVRAARVEVARRIGGTQLDVLDEVAPRVGERAALERVKPPPKSASPSTATTVASAGASSRALRALVSAAVQSCLPM
jgi:hypothetical protein